MASLTRKEMEFVEKVNAIAEWLSRPRSTHSDVIHKFIETFPIPKKGGGERRMSIAEAKKWLDKALDVLRTGSQRHQDVARGIYASRLLRLADTAEQHMIVSKQEIEMRPVRDAAGNATSQMAVWKVRKMDAVLNPAVLAQVRQLLKEYAHVTGARPKDPTVLINKTDQNALGSEGARDLRTMTAEGLARLMGGDVKILPNKDAELGGKPHERGEGDRPLPPIDVPGVSRPAEEDGKGK